MNYLGIDYGSKRIGLSYADDLGVAMPVEAAVQPLLQDRIEHILQVIRDKAIDAIVVGLPLNMDGTAGQKAEEVNEFVEKLRKRIELPVHMFDERLTTEQVQSDLKGMGGKKVKSIGAIKKKRRSGELDSRVAALILQEFLDEKAQGS